jgi:hypothetical protein
MAADRSVAEVVLRRYARVGVGVALVGLLCMSLTGGCRMPTNSTNPSDARRDINAVLAAHDDEWMARPGVVGVYVGLLDDQKTPCLKVMLARKDRKLERSIPCAMEGYPVITEVTGEINPLRP